MRLRRCRCRGSCTDPGESGPLDIAGPEGATVQVTGIGESKTEYLDAADDPTTRYGR
jgi:hypothetical protein